MNAATTPPGRELTPHNVCAAAGDVTAHRSKTTPPPDAGDSGS